MDIFGIGVGKAKQVRDAIQKGNIEAKLNIFLLEEDAVAGNVIVEKRILFHSKSQENAEAY